MKTWSQSAMLLLALVCSGEPVAAQTAKELYVELRDAGGVHLLAQLVCFPAAGQDLDTTFTLVAFSKDFASTLRAVFSVSGRYSRDVLVDDVVTTSKYGRCEPIE